MVAKDNGSDGMSTVKREGGGGGGRRGEWSLGGERVR